MPDSEIRRAAFEWLAAQVEIHGDVLPWALLVRGFELRGERVPLVSMQGIFKPRVMELPLSIRTAPGWCPKRVLVPRCIFRSNPATESARRRPVIPGQGGHGFRRKAATFSPLVGPVAALDRTGGRLRSESTEGRC
jgi:hypothetical protein